MNSEESHKENRNFRQCKIYIIKADERQHTISKTEVNKTF